MNRLTRHRLNRAIDAAGTVLLVWLVIIAFGLLGTMIGTVAFALTGSYGVAVATVVGVLASIVGGGVAGALPNR